MPLPESATGDLPLTTHNSHPLPATLSTFHLEPETRCTYIHSVRIVSFITAVIAAYLLGSIPTGYLVAKVKGVDIRTVGSGKIGATNVFRILAKPAGIFVLVFDGLKGFAACVWLGGLIIKLF